MFTKNLRVNNIYLIFVCVTVYIYIFEMYTHTIILITFCIPMLFEPIFYYYYYYY